jgi:1-acyl-sn-glycerol-3-phosphate acyltransferase
VNVCFARIFHRLEVCSPCQLPKTGPAILACNHISGLDPSLIQAACPRLIIWMMAREYYDQPALRWFFRMLNSIPVDRSGKDVSATRRALRALSEGHVLGIFPEGRIETDHSLLPFQIGVAMMAAKTNVGIYPTYLDGTQRGRNMLQACFTPQTAKIAFGPVVEVNPQHQHRPDLEAATKGLEEAIAGLRQRLCPQPLEKIR